MYIYMNTCVCTYIDVPSSSSWGDMLETGNPDNTTGETYVFAQFLSSSYLLPARRGRRKRKLEPSRF